MPRSLRLEYPNAQYHILARGNGRQDIVFNDGDRRLFVRTLEELCHKTGWKVFAWVLMDNHYHMAVRTPEANLVEGMKWFQNAFTRRINTRNDRWGHLFGDRYKSILVESREHSKRGSWSSYLSTLVDYIHLNPARAGIIDGVQKSCMDYPWSSLAHGYVKPSDGRPDWLAVEEGLGLARLEDSVKGRRKYIQRLDERIIAEEEKAGLAENRDSNTQSSLRKGWYWGSQHFREKILEKFNDKLSDKKSRTYQSSSLNKAHGQQQAEQLIRDACKHYRVKEEVLLMKSRGDMRKASLAWKIWQETTVSQAWIAERLQLKSPANVSQQVRRFANLPNRELDDVVLKWKEKSRIVD